jgi:hypothetical protein
MSYQERRALIELISTVVTTVIYSAYMVQRFPQVDAYAPEVFHFWGAFFLILIPASIVVRIIIYIIFSIFNTIATQEAEPSITDERDRLIELKSTVYSLYVFAGGFMLAMFSLVASQPPSVMFVIMVCAGTVSSMVSELLQFYFYRRGV